MGANRVPWVAASVVAPVVSAADDTVVHRVMTNAGAG
jgi:hypothetical protein